MKNIHKIIIFNILFSMVNFLFSSEDLFYDIKDYYDNGDFIGLREFLQQKKDEILPASSLEEEYQLLYIKIFEAKSLFCLGKLDSVSALMHEIQSDETYKNLLFHDLQEKNLCEHEKCICTKYKFSGYELMDAWYERDKLFASVWIVVKKKRGASNEYFQIPDPTVVKYNASHDVMYMLKGPQQALKKIPPPDENDIIKYDKEIAQYNRIDDLNKEFMSMAKEPKKRKRLEFIEKLFDNEDYYSLKIPYLPILNKSKKFVKDDWYKLYTVDTRENEISRNSFRLKRTRKDHQKNYKLFIRWNQNWTLHEAIDNNIISLEFPEEYLKNSEDRVFSIDGINILLTDSLKNKGIEFGGVEERPYEKWRFPDSKYGDLLNEEKELIETRRYDINVNSYKSEDIEIIFHDGYADYNDEIKEIKKTKTLSIIAISLSLLLILFFQ